MQAVLCGDAEIVIAGGQENMSQSQHTSCRARATVSDGRLEDGGHHDRRRPVDAFNNCHMGVTAENIADKYEFSRAEQDAFARLPAEDRRPRSPPAASTTRSSPSRSRSARAIRWCSRRTSSRAPAPPPRARQAASRLRQGRHRHRRQRIGHQRRRRRRRGHERGQGEGARAQTIARIGLRQRRRRSGHHGHGPDPGLRASAWSGRLVRCRPRPG
jgi:hypothetical protein